MRKAGLQPIELERYSSSNKIWITKVKRLRLPDLLCVRTGLRVEVRAKSVLAIRMSDSPTNPARRWCAGLRPQDLIAFVACTDSQGVPTPAQTAEFFWVRHIASAEAASKLGPPKSASEGAERDREWRTIRPKNGGVVLEVGPEQLKVQTSAGRRQTYRLNGLHAYVTVGHGFVPHSEFLAGLPRRKALLSEVHGRTWNPRSEVTGDAVDRYVAAKALGVVGSDADLRILRRLTQDEDSRVALEAAGSLAKLGDHGGLSMLAQAVISPPEPHLRMEAVFLLSELGSCDLRGAAVDALLAVARNQSLAGNEVRQAAIWGLGRAGLLAHHRLIEFLDAPDPDERIHALVAFGPDLSDDVTRTVIRILVSEESAQKKAAACHVLSALTACEYAIHQLVPIALSESRAAAAWAKAALGSLSPDATARLIRDQQLAESLAPMQLLAPSNNWTKSEAAHDAISFVSKQGVCLG